MDPVNNNDLKAAIERVSGLATELYDLMESGMTIDFTFQKEEVIVVPGKLPKLNRLIVTKPRLHLALEAPKGTDREPKTGNE